MFVIILIIIINTTTTTTTLIITIIIYGYNYHHYHHHHLWAARGSRSGADWERLGSVPNLRIICFIFLNLELGFVFLLDFNIWFPDPVNTS